MRNALITLVFFTIILPVTLAWLIVDSKPIVTSSPASQLNESDTLKPLYAQLESSFKLNRTIQSLDVSETHFNAILGFVQRAHSEFRGIAEIHSESLLLSFTYQIPNNPLGRYINCRIALLPGQGIQIKNLQLGSITLPGNWATELGIWLMNWYTQSNIAHQLLEVFKGIELDSQRLSLRLNPISPSLLAQLSQIDLLFSDPTDQDLINKTARYLKFLSESSLGHSAKAVSLAEYISLLFEEVAKENQSLDSQRENEAAIMALVTYAGHHFFGYVVGDIQPNKNQYAKPQVKPVLAGREDLALHFLFSAGLKIISKKSVSNAVGEFKELMDRGAGGSGYSFVDLMADKAGVQFAQVAFNPSTASILQKMMAETHNERVFFPDIQNLPEGLDSASFAEKYGEVDSSRYLAIISDIKHRIEQLPISQLDQTTQVDIDSSQP